MDPKRIDSLDVVTGIARERAKYVQAENYWALLVLGAILVLAIFAAKFIGAPIAVVVIILGALVHFVALKTGFYLPAERKETSEAHGPVRVI